MGEIHMEQMEQNLYFDPAGIVDLSELDELAYNNSDVHPETTPTIAWSLISIMTIETTATVSAAIC